MKKQYILPIALIEEIETIHLIAASLEVKDGETDEMLSDGRLWSGEWNVDLDDELKVEF